MNRRELLQGSAGLGFTAAVPHALFKRFEGAVETGSGNSSDSAASAPVSNPLKPPANDRIRAAFVIATSAVLVDYCGPWVVFDAVDVPNPKGDAFELYTVAETTTPIKSEGLTLTSDYTFETAPAPRVIIVPAIDDRTKVTPAMLQWIRKSSEATDLTMSVCAGAFVLGQAGLLDGKAATTHHKGYKGFAAQFPKTQLKRGVRFVDDGKISTAGGLTSGIDLALHVVERYFGRDVAEKTAYFLEYQGKGWLDPSSNSIYGDASEAEPKPEAPQVKASCPLCGMTIDPATAQKSVYKGQTYYFCQMGHKGTFDADPERFAPHT